ncbi:MAG: hydantoinase/oxoprolinase family protein [Pseudomonadota bacterium]|nr:hydantoinase/oxoprolinase family protein [Pseudomonadota bacterium]
MSLDEETVVRIAADIGGTFTDAASIGPDGYLYIGKTLTTPGRETDGIIAAVGAAGVPPEAAKLFVHGTTMVINALLERRGVKTAMITTQGFADILSLGRGNRPEPYNPFYIRNAPLIPRDLRFEVVERMAANGAVVVPLERADLERVAEEIRAVGAEAVAIGFLNSYRNPGHERFAAEVLRELLPDAFVTTSSELASQWREYERFTTASANAYVGPLVRRYTERLVDALTVAGFEGDALFLDAGGGAVGRETIQSAPIRLIESGPVGGAIGAAHLAREIGLDKVVTLDIGGTTAKTCLIEDGMFETLDEFWVGGYTKGLPVQVPVLDIHEVGAGGGSIAGVAQDGRLTVGPRSAGAEPGPAAYGKGGQQPTVTDALVWCGLLHPKCFLAEIDISRDLAAGAIGRLASETGLDDTRMALGILEIASNSIAAAVRQQTLERGHDPERFSMVISGGAGPALACKIAEQVGLSRVVFPQSPGHFSAIGMLRANLRFSNRIVVSRTLDDMNAEDLARDAKALQDKIAASISDSTNLAGTQRVEHYATLRYLGQDHTLRVPFDLSDLSTALATLRETFIAAYTRRFAYSDANSPLEMVEMEVAVSRDLPSDIRFGAAADTDGEAGDVECLFSEADGFVATQTLLRSNMEPGQTVAGPALIYEPGTICVIPPGWEATKSETCLVAEVTR